ncbi:MAG TPA: sucrase ferredoxin [Gaiellaceae bacterium]|nr:sucrase ferredoxin [Gaiellaceae bacterium]
MSVQPGPSVRSRAFCAAVSTANDEPLAATASRIDSWILLEYRGMWDRDVLGASLLSDRFKAHVREQLQALAPSRLLFVKKPERRATGRRHVYFGSSRVGEERLYGLEVDHLEDLVDFDFAAALAAGEPPGVPVTDPLLVVCTHGKRDRCCAKNGRPVYDALRRETDSGHVWQSTHVGGDRFAGNVVVFPQALYYGRVEPEAAPGLLAAHAAGRIDLDRYRGRAAYTFPSQAAEHAVREAEGLLGIDDLALVRCRRAGEDVWRVRFRGPEKAVFEADVAAELGDEETFLTCCAARPSRPRHFRATAVRRVS